MEAIAALFGFWGHPAILGEVEVDNAPRAEYLDQHPEKRVSQNRGAHLGPSRTRKGRRYPPLACPSCSWMRTMLTNKQQPAVLTPGRTTV